MHVKRNWYVTFNGVNLNSTYGLVLSSYETEIPEAKVKTVEIPAGVELDITDSIGQVGFHFGKQRFVFLLQAETEAERKEKLRSLTTYVHGVRANYTLSWETSYTYTGRGALYVEHLTPTADVITLEITCESW